MLHIIYNFDEMNRFFRTDETFKFATICHLLKYVNKQVKFKDYQYSTCTRKSVYMIIILFD